MVAPVGKGSLSGLQTLVALAIGTRQMAAARAMPNLVEAFNQAIDAAERAPSLEPGEMDRKYAFTRLANLQRVAMQCFTSGEDIKPKVDE